MCAVDAEKDWQAKQFEHKQRQKHAEFQNMLKWAKIEKETKIKLKNDANGPAAVPASTDKKYVPRLPALYPEDILTSVFVQI